MNAREIYQSVQTMCGESAHELVGEWESLGKTHDDETDKILKSFKEKGVTDIAGAYADHQFNDKELLKDLVGDMIYDAASTKEGRDSVISELLNLVKFPAWTTAMNELREEFKTL